MTAISFYRSPQRTNRGHRPLLQWGVVATAGVRSLPREQHPERVLILILIFGPRSRRPSAVVRRGRIDQGRSIQAGRTRKASPAGPPKAPRSEGTRRAGDPGAFLWFVSQCDFLGHAKK